MTNAGVEEQDAQKVETAASAIERHDYETAQRLLGEVTRNAPERYEFLRREGTRTWVKCWTFVEFLAYVKQPDVRNGGQGEVLWKRSAYPRAFFLLAHMDVEERRFEEALQHLSAALRLEPDHPEVLYEVGLVHSLTGQHEKALQFMEAALACRPFNSDASRARALRGMGVALIDLGQFREAETRFKESLDLQPQNESALRELRYIQHLRDGGNRLGVAGTWEKRTDPPPMPDRPTAAPTAPAQAAAERSAASQESVGSHQSTKAWGMTDVWSTSITCPSCTAQDAVCVYRSINVTLNPELKAPLLQQELTRHRCSQCGAVISLNHGLLYHDEEKRLIIHLVAHKPGAAAPSAVTNGYTLRRCRLSVRANPKGTHR